MIKMSSSVQMFQLKLGYTQKGHFEFSIVPRFLQFYNITLKKKSL